MGCDANTKTTNNMETTDNNDSYRCLNSYLDDVANAVSIDKNLPYLVIFRI